MAKRSKPEGDGPARTFDPATLYKVTVSEVFDHKNTRFRPRHVYRLAGAVANEIADRIATVEIVGPLPA